MEIEMAEKERERENTWRKKFSTYRGSVEIEHSVTQKRERE